MSEAIGQAGEESFEIPSTPRTADEHEIGWIELSTAVRFLGRFKTVLQPQEPQEALLSALRSGLVSARCDNTRPLEQNPRLKVGSSRNMAPREWAEATQFNIWDNAINLHDGGPATDIEVSKYEIYHWLSLRGSHEPDWLFSDFQSFALEAELTIVVADDGAVTALKPKRQGQSRGGRKPDPAWPNVLIYFMAHALIGAPTLNPTTSKDDVVRQILDSAAKHFPDFSKSVDRIERAYASTILAAVASAYEQKGRPIKPPKRGATPS